MVSNISICTQARVQMLCKSPSSAFQTANKCHTKVTGSQHWCIFILLPQFVSLCGAPYCERRGVECPVAVVPMEEASMDPHMATTKVVVIMFGLFFVVLFSFASHLIWNYAQLIIQYMRRRGR